MTSDFWKDFWTKPAVYWDTPKKKVVNNYYTINNYYIHTENKIIKVNEEEFRRFIEKKNLKEIT